MLHRRSFVVLGLTGFALLAVSALVIVLRSPTLNAGIPLQASGFTENELFERGRYLVTAGNCASCHTSVSGEFMAGGVAFKTEFGTIYSTNITPDPETGIGGWTDREFLNALRYGVRPNGEHLYPAFPYTSLALVTDQDILAMFAYMQRVPAVKQTPPDNSLGFPYNLRSLMAFWKFLYFKPEVYEPVAERSAEWNRGAYLVEGLAHCSACHTPRNRLGAKSQSQHMGGGEYLDRIPGGEYRHWSAPSLTSAGHGLDLWEHDDLSQYLLTGENRFLQTFGPMNDVILNSTRYLKEVDIRAMATYLKALPSVDKAPSTPPSAELMGQGQTIYNLHCGTCHLPSGEGDTDMGPALNSASLVVQSDNPASMINAILYGPQLPDPSGESRWLEPMKPYQYLLTNEEVAAVASFIRNSWSNDAGQVSLAQVAQQR